MPIQIKSFEVMINGVTYRAENVQQVSPPESKKRLILTLSEDVNVSYCDYTLERRVKAVIAVLSRVFPGILAVMTDKERTVGPFKEMVFVLRDAKDKHMNWASSAKECGLIDSYLVDYDPEV